MARVLVRPALGACLGVLLSIGCSVGEEPPDPDMLEYVVPGALFSVQAPRPLEAGSRATTTDLGEIVDHHYSLIESDVVLVAGYTRLPEEIDDALRGQPFDALMRAGRDGLLRHLDAQLLRERSIMLGGRPDGREVVARLRSTGGVLVFRSYWVGATLYHVQASLPPNPTPAQRRLADRFLDSIQISAKRS